MLIQLRDGIFRTVGETNAGSTLALEVLSSMAENESFDDMNFEGEGQDYLMK